jgi:hypothetical protein
MNYQANISAVAAMAMQREAHMTQDGIRPALCYLINGGRHVYQPVYRAHGYAMIHGDYYSSPSFAIQDALQSDRLSDLAHERELVNAGIKDDGRVSIVEFDWKKNRIMVFREIRE